MHPWTGFTFLSVNYSHFKHDSVQSEAPSEATDPCENVIKMAIIKEASEDIKIEETFRVKQEDRRGELRKRGEKKWRFTNKQNTKQKGFRVQSKTKETRTERLPHIHPWKDNNGTEHRCRYTQRVTSQQDTPGNNHRTI